MVINLSSHLTKEIAGQLHVGDRCLLSGVIYTARDAAHQRLCTQIAKGKPLPFPIRDAVIYFVGPTPARQGQVIGSAGPTSSYRMDAYSPTLMAQGLTGMIGKGNRSAPVIDAIRNYGAVYFGAIGGCGALLSRCIKRAEIVAYEDLGAEAIRRLEVENFPAIVVIDSAGNNLYETGQNAYLEEVEKEGRISGSDTLP